MPEPAKSEIFHGITAKLTLPSDRKVNEPSLATKFLAGVDLRGFRYDRIGVVWRDLLSRLTPYDRQPYAQLEKVLRSTGQDEDGDKVYYECRRIEGNRLKPWNSFGWYWDRPFRYLAGYGTRIMPLVATLLFLVLFLGPLVFSRQGAVTEKLEAQAPAANSQPKAAKPTKQPEKLVWFDAFGLGLRLFIGLDVPSGSKWVPSENPLIKGHVLGVAVSMRYSTYATVHRVIGWLLVPIVVASLAQRLRRRTPG